MRFAARRWACCLLFAFWGCGEIDAAGPARSHLGSWDDYYVGRVIPDLVATKWHGEQHVGESVVIDVTRIQDDVDQVRHIVRRFNAGELDDFVLQLLSPLVVPYVVVDINGDQQLDFLSAAEKQTGTFLWRAAENDWQRVEFPTTLGSVGGRLAAMRDDQKPTLLIRSVAQRGAWYFHDGQWQAAPACLRGLDVGATRLLTSAGGIDRGLRFHDLTGDGVDELIVANADCQVILQWSSAEQRWRDTGLHWPAEAVFVTNDGADAGCRLADVNGDGRVDLLMSDEER